MSTNGLSVNRNAPAESPSCQDPNDELGTASILQEAEAQLSSIQFPIAVPSRYTRYELLPITMVMTH